MNFISLLVACSTYLKWLKSQGDVMKLFHSMAYLAVMLSTHLHAAIQPLSDEQMALQTGQSLLNLNYIAPTGSGTGATATDFGFYKLGIQAVLNLNANIRSLKLGCDGANATGACDIDLGSVSFGCVTNSSGVCIPVSGTNSVSGVSSTASRSNLKDFTLTNPFLQIAIKNPTSASTREFAGVRFGADNSSGPLSFGNINSVSGYLTAAANLNISGDTNVAVTCRYPTSCIATNANTTGIKNNGASSWGSPVTGTRGGKGTPAGGYLNLGDDMILNLGLAKIRYQEALVGYQSVARTGLGIELFGSRQTQAFISGVNFGGIVNSIIYGNTDGSTTVGASPLELVDSDAGGLVSALGPTLLPLLRGGIADTIKRQMAQGLRIYSSDATTNQSIVDGKADADINTDLNNYILPYNASNLHQTDVNSSSFGLSMQKQAIQYPGYLKEMPKGFALYLPDAFTLDINNPLSTRYDASGNVTSQGILSNITQTSAARDGNIVGLDAAYNNCYGTLTFC
jgi:hypothetical protein